MAPQNRKFRRTPSHSGQRSDPRRLSWFQRLHQRVSTSFTRGGLWQGMRSRNSTNPNLTSLDQSLVRAQPLKNQQRDEESSTNMSLAALIARVGRRLSTPTQNSRPKTAPDLYGSVNFRPIRWETLNNDAESSSGSLAVGPRQSCPYDPDVLQFFPNFEASTSMCGLGSEWPWIAKRKPPTPCDHCLLGTSHAHINGSPNRFSKKHSNAQRRSSSASNSKESITKPAEEQVSSDVLISRLGKERKPQFPWQVSLKLSSTSSLTTRPPERMGFHRDPDRTATFNRLKEVVESTSSRFPKSPSRPRSPPPKLHQLSPDVSFIHRHEVAAHQAAIREGRHSPVLQHQALGGSSVEVVGYTFKRSRKDSSFTALYSESDIPGEYLPPSPPEIPSPTHVLSPFRRDPISLTPVLRPVLIPRLDQPPFVPALPEGTVLRPVREWVRARPHSAPEDYETVLRHSAVYRARNADHSPRVPSPLHEQHGADSFLDDGSGDASRWSHGTMPLEEEGVKILGGTGTGGWRDVKGGGKEKEKEAKMRGGAADVFFEWHSGEIALLPEQCCRTRTQEMLDFVPRVRHPSEYQTRIVPREDYSLASCMQPTHQMPRLRGGGGGGGLPNRKSMRIPASLFYLAGATGRKPGESITVDAWNSMKPQKRMGGLLGMAVHGFKGGKPYIPETRDQCVQTEVGGGGGMGTQTEGQGGGKGEESEEVEGRGHASGTTPEPAAAKTPTPAASPPPEPSDGGAATPKEAPSRNGDKIPAATSDNATKNAPDPPPSNPPTADANPPYPTSPEAPPVEDQTPGSGPNTGAPYPRTPPDAKDAEKEKDDAPEDGNVPMPMTPEELLRQTIEEMRAKLRELGK